MGTYYTLGIIKKISARSREDQVNEAQGRNLLSEWIDPEIFDIDIQDKSINATLKNASFENNIADFYSKLKEITGQENIDYYFNEYGTKLEDYPDERFQIRNYDSNIGEIGIEFMLLFIEGKVSAEEFSIEPKLIHWLFRHCDFENPLARCVISDIIG